MLPKTTNAVGLIIRPYRLEDRAGVRAIYGDDEFCRPALLARYPRMREYLADSMSYYTDYEPESLFVADSGNRIVGALLGAVATQRCERLRDRVVQRTILRRCLSGTYGLPIWYWPIWLTELAQRDAVYPEVDLHDYPAHLHIGILPRWRRQGIGTALMAAYADYLSARDIPGYHLYASSFHPMGVWFYYKLGLTLLDAFDWPLHTGIRWIEVTELIFAKRCL